MSRAAQLQWTEPVTNKVNAFLSDERISQMLSVPKSSFTLREIMDNRKILLLKLNKGKLKESADLLGSLYMAKLQLAAFSRTDIPEAARVPFYLYIDEFQNFASESFSVVLSEARKYGLSLIMAHQTLEQIPTELRSVILGNAGIQVYFRMNRHDAQLLAKEAFTYSGYNVKTVQMRGEWIDARYWSLGEEWERNFAKLQSLPPRHCIVKHKIQGGMLPLATVSIEPAFTALGMNPQEYTQYLDSLPFGQKYLIERASLTQQPAQTHPAQPRDAVQPEVTPQLGEQQQQFLEFIIANPDTAQTAVYKGIRVGVLRGNEIRDSLLEQGLIEQIETRLGKMGRRTVFFVPTFTALERLGIEPPAGRGGIVHRYLQHLIEEGATAKGYTAKVEHDLGNGGFMDVHLEKDGVRIAVEIAVVSKPQRELAHIKHCLAVGYDKVYVVFLEQRLLERTTAALAGFSDEEVEKIRLVHVSHLSQVF
jgi:TraM recognition site of TraD and TraG